MQTILSEEKYAYLSNGFEVIIQEIFHQNKFLLFEFSDCLEAIFVSPSSIVGECNRNTELFFWIISSLILLSEYNTVIILHKNTCYFHQSFPRAWCSVPLAFYMELDQAFIYKQKSLPKSEWDTLEEELQDFSQIQSQYCLSFQLCHTHWFQFFHFLPPSTPHFYLFVFYCFLTQL